MMEHLLISACLLGAQCRYDGQSKPVLEMVALSEQFDLVPLCPEQLGGLPTPRTPAERIGDRVITKDGMSQRNTAAARSRHCIWRVCAAAGSCF